MAIILQSEPANELLAATIDSGSLEYIVDITINTGSPTRPNVDAVLKVEFIVNSNVINEEAYNKSVYAYLGGNLHQYRFTIDAQENVQNFFDESNLSILDLFRPLQSSGTNAGYQAILQLKFYELIPNVNDLLEEQVTTQVSNLRNVINAYINHEHTQDLQAFDNNIGPKDAEWLSEKPDSMNVLCRDDDEQLAGWDMGIVGNITGITFVGYNKLGVSISPGAMNNIPANQDQVTIFPVGPQNIINASGWTLTPPVMPSNPNMAYYTVKISTANKSVLKRYWLKDGCCDTRYRFYFRNRFGFFDTFDIEGMDLQTYTVESEFYEQQRATEYSPTNRGFSKIVAIGRNSWEFSKFRITEEEREFLKQFVKSTMVYMQTARYSGSSGLFLRPVTIRDAGFKIADNTSNLPVEMVFAVDAANTDKSQRN